MKPGIIAAIVVSAVLISGAFFLRPSSKPLALGLTAVENPQALSDAQHKELLAKFSGPTSKDTASPTEAGATTELTTSDLVGRQLILDYISLAQNGQASGDNLSALVERYVESIPSIASSAGITLTDLHVVPNSTAAFSTYGTVLKVAYEAYANGLNSAYSPEADIGGTQGESMTKKMGSVYAQTAKKLQEMAVPAELSSIHLSLINIYLQNASSMSAMSRTSSDPTSSFAGLIAIKSNAAQEQEILGEIQAILNKHGI